MIYSPTKTEYFPPPPVAELDQAQLSFANKQPPKKKRKSRTAFTNHQIFELEKRFLYQKYLSPADRDEIAAALGLTNAQVSQTMRSYQGLREDGGPISETSIIKSKTALFFQVITWFQNRRAKLKRDMEELRKDVECSPHVHAVSAMAAAGQTHMAAAVAASLAARTMSPPEHAAMAAAMAASAARYNAVTCYFKNWNWKCCSLSTRVKKVA